LDGGLALEAIDATARELALFACVGLLICGIDDLLIDLIWLRVRKTDVRAVLGRRRRLAIFVPAWDESSVLAAMLSNTLKTLRHPRYRIYVGLYWNDRATVRAVLPIAYADPRIRLVFNPRAGPTTKGDNLNAMWRALLRDEVTDGWIADAVVQHDAEDLIHPDELGAFDALLDHHAVVQLPVLPLIAANSRWISAHYADEFAWAHARTMPVRERLGAGLPLAGVGCALRRDALLQIARERDGNPFDAHSITEDYELGLALSDLGAEACFARVADAQGRLICVRSYFPLGLAEAARQKARWIAGIALLGWDRIGWGGMHAGEWWMRMRDRRGPLAMVVLAAAYAATIVGGLAAAIHLATGIPAAPPSVTLAWLITINSALLAWRLATRGWTTARAYGWREGLRAVPRAIVGNVVGLWAMCRAVGVYFRALQGRTPDWDKTTHIFPGQAGA
jgi:adsorption protein B